MALVSSPALLLKRCVAASTVFIGLISISCFGQPVFFAVPSTPYDRQMIPVNPVLTSTSVQWSSPISLFAVNQWMTELRAMPYQYSRYWQTPAEVDLAQASDCKGKAVALYAEMRRNGAKNVRVVIGKRHIYASVTHAWLEWETQEGSYMLDPTFNEMPIKTAELTPMTYIPLYAYDGEHKYRAADASFVASTTKVAAGYSNHLSVTARARSTFAQSGLTRIGSGQSFPATSGYATLSTQYPQPDTQRAWSNARRSSPYVVGLHQAGAIAAAPSAEYIRTQPRSVSMRGRQTSNVRHSRSHTARLRQVRSSVSSQNLEFVMQMQLKRLPPQL